VKEGQLSSKVGYFLANLALVRDISRSEERRSVEEKELL